MLLENVYKQLRVCVARLWVSFQVKLAGLNVAELQCGVARVKGEGHQTHPQKQPDNKSKLPLKGNCVDKGVKRSQDLLII